MDCSQAEVAMLKHMEKIITTEEAGLLHEHILDCDSCREYYLAFDEVMEFAATAETSDWEEAPASLTVAVMAEVKNMPVYTKQAAKKSISKKHYAFYIAWGSSLVFLAAALFIAYNPTYIENLAYAYPIVASIVNAMRSIWAAIGSMLDWVVQSTSTLSIENNISIAALLFVFVLGSLLVALHKDDEKGIA